MSIGTSAIAIHLISKQAVMTLNLLCLSFIGPALTGVLSREVQKQHSGEISQTNTNHFNTSHVSGPLDAFFIHSSLD